MQKKNHTPSTLSPSPSPNPPHSSHSSQRHNSKSSVSSNEGVTPPPSHLELLPSNPVQQDTPTSDSAFIDEEGGGGGVASNPSMDVVHAHIKSITQCIQELLQGAQAYRQARCVCGGGGGGGGCLCLCVGVGVHTVHDIVCMCVCISPIHTVFTYSFGPCSAKTSKAVDTMTKLFPTVSYNAQPTGQIS